MKKSILLLTLIVVSACVLRAQYYVDTVFINKQVANPNDSIELIVRGHSSDLCAYLLTDSVVQNENSIMYYAEWGMAEVCGQAFKNYEKKVKLGTFAPGEYIIYYSGISYSHSCNYFSSDYYYDDDFDPITHKSFKIKLIVSEENITPPAGVNQLACPHAGNSFLIGQAHIDTEIIPTAGNCNENGTWSVIKGSANIILKSDNSTAFKNIGLGVNVLRKSYINGTETKHDDIFIVNLSRFGIKLNNSQIYTCEDSVVVETFGTKEFETEWSVVGGSVYITKISDSITSFKGPYWGWNSIRYNVSNKNKTCHYIQGIGIKHKGPNGSINYGDKYSSFNSSENKKTNLIQLSQSTDTIKLAGYNFMYRREHFYTWYSPTNSPLPQRIQTIPFPETYVEFTYLFSNLNKGKNTYIVYDTMFCDTYDTIIYNYTPPKEYYIESDPSSAVNSMSKLGFCVGTARPAIGLDIDINYNPDSLKFNGVIDVLQIAQNYLDISYNNDSLNGKLHLSIALSAQAPENVRISGTGRMFNIIFNSAFPYCNGASLVTLKKVTESFFLSTKEYTDTTTAWIVIDTKMTYQGQVSYWNNAQYDLGGNNSNLSLWYDPSMTQNKAGVINQSGSFIFSDSIKKFSILRDIPGSYDNTQAAISVLNSINGYDAFLLKKIINKDIAFKPNLYQIVASDVNMDGKITAGDLSQLNRRSVMLQREFIQPHNYDNYGKPINNKLSFDWLFTDTTLWVNHPIFTISASYPENDALGYSIYKVPALAQIFETGDINCFNYQNNHLFKGIMLGDIDGNCTPNSELKKSETSPPTMIIKWSEAQKIDGLINIPVYVEADTDVYSLDFEMTNTDVSFVFTGIVNYEASEYLYNQYAEKLLFTSNNLAPLSTENKVFAMNFKSDEQRILPSFLSQTKAYINGSNASVFIDSQQALNVDLARSNLCNIYPNPANHTLFINYDSNYECHSIEIINAQGKTVFIKTGNSNISAVDVSNLKPGFYILKSTINHTPVYSKFQKH